MAKFCYILSFGLSKDSCNDGFKVYTLASLLYRYRMIRKSKFPFWSLFVLNLDSLESVTIIHDVAHWSLYRFEHKVKSIKNYLIYGNKKS